MATSLAVKPGTIPPTTFSSSHFSYSGYFSLSLPQSSPEYSTFHCDCLSKASAFPMTYTIEVQTTIVSYLDKGNITKNNFPNFTFTLFQAFLFIEAKVIFRRYISGQSNLPSMISLLWEETLQSLTVTWCVALPHQCPQPQVIPVSPLLHTLSYTCVLSFFRDPKVVVVVVVSNLGTFYLHFFIPGILYFSATPSTHDMCLPHSVHSSENSSNILPGELTLSSQLRLVSLFSQHLPFPLIFLHYSL